MASVFETCAFNNVNVLKFLLSRETTLEGLMQMAGRKFVHGPISVRVITTSTERQRFDALLKGEAVRGPRVPVGQRLYQVAEQDGKWVGLLLWCAPALRLRDRDDWIGWDTFTRRERRNLIVKQARFFVPHSAQRPDLASRILTAATTALPDQWFALFGYAPLLAETLTGPEGHASTCYEAAGWFPVSHITGLGLHHCNSRSTPKRIWLKLLDPQGKEILCSGELSARQAAALHTGIGAHIALDATQRSSLKEALRQMTDPRGMQGKRYPLAPTLTILALGLLAGKVRLPEIIRFGTGLSQVQRQALGFWAKPGTGFYPAPTTAVLRRLLIVLDLEALTGVLTGWLQSQAGLLPSSLIVARKTIRERLDRILSLIRPSRYL